MVDPMNAPVATRSDILPVLMPDTPGDDAGTRTRKLHFLQRTARNPLTLLRLLQKEPPSLVIFNDFEQITAPFWVPMFKATASRHTYAVVLHDPDRDNYPPNRRTSVQCMKALMSLMDFGLYHQHLPDKPYYAGKRTKYIDVPHGLYPPPAPDYDLVTLLSALKRPELQYATILGNIREEKNYTLALQALQRLPNMGLIIAGRASNQGVRTDTYKEQALALGVAERVVWVERFLTEAEMAAVIHASDLILLYYARTFTSQSGVLNTVAPMRKTIVASDGESSLAHTLRQFPIGVLAEPDNLDALCEALDTALHDGGPQPEDWDRYLAYASWTNHADTLLRAAKGSVELSLED
jgi:glycosyltransferase involved in cell wall biosynthesis